MKTLIFFLINLNKKYKQLIQFLCDIVFVLLSFILTLYIQNESIIFLHNTNVLIILISFIFINLITLSFLGIYRAVVRHISTESIKHIGIGVWVAAIFMYLTSQVFAVNITTNIIFVFSLL